MNIHPIRNQLNEKLVEIWAYRKYITPEQKLCHSTAKKVQFIQKFESVSVFAEEDYTALRRLYTAKNMEMLRKKRLLQRCQNTELKIRLEEEIIKIKLKLKWILKKLKKTLKDYCSYRAQIIVFKIRYYDLYDFCCKYYEEVINECYY